MKYGETEGAKLAAQYLAPVRQKVAEKAAATRTMNDAKKLLPPVERHYIDKVRRKSIVRPENTVIEPWVDAKADLADIKAGKATRGNNTYTVNGRTYGWEPSGRLYPISGLGFHQLDRGAFKALGVYNQMGNTTEAETQLDKDRITPKARASALKAWLAARRDR